MRTTINLPDDLHRAAQALAHDRHQSLSRTVEELMRRGLRACDSGGAGGQASNGIEYRDGFPTLASPSGRVITAEDVRRLEDE